MMGEGINGASELGQYGISSSAASALPSTAATASAEQVRPTRPVVAATILQG